MTGAIVLVETHLVALGVGLLLGLLMSRRQYRRAREQYARLARLHERTHVELTRAVALHRAFLTCFRPRDPAEYEKARRMYYQTLGWFEEQAIRRQFDQFKETDPS